MDLNTWNLGSISGVILVTLGLTEILKRVFSKNEGFGKIPVFVYSIVIAVILATVANKFLKTPEGNPVLAGDYLIVVWKAFIGAASASGFYSWLNNPESVGSAQPLWRNDNDPKTGTPDAPK